MDLFDGLEQVHVARIMAGERMTWPEVEEAEDQHLREQITAAFG